MHSPMPNVSAAPSAWQLDEYFWMVTRGDPFSVVHVTPQKYVLTFIAHWYVYAKLKALFEQV